MATLYIYDEIGPPEWGLIGAKTVADFLAEIPSNEELQIRINSPGGSVMQALAIRELLKEHEGPKTYSIDALAASAATFLPTDGDPVVMAEAGRYFIHSPWTSLAGNAEELRRAADELDKIEEDLLDIYARRVRQDLTREQLAEMLAAETMLTADEALEFGFIDSIRRSSESVAACWRFGVFEKFDSLFAGNADESKAEARREAATERAKRGFTAADRERLQRMGSDEFRKLSIRG